MCGKLKELGKLYVLGDYEKTCSNLMEKVDWTKIPVNIKEILNRLDIPYGEWEFKDSEKQLRKADAPKGIQGMIHVEKDDIKIYYNPIYKDELASEHKISFTLAHELAHGIIHAQEIDDANGFLDLYRFDEAQEDVKEVEANTLAGEILMPRKVVITLFETAMETKTLSETKLALSEIFNVSLNVVEARLKYLNLINEN